LHYTDLSDHTRRKKEKSLTLSGHDPRLFSKTFSWASYFQTLMLLQVRYHISQAHKKEIKFIVSYIFMLVKKERKCIVSYIFHVCCFGK
jgi:hypothetical protein